MTHIYFIPATTLWALRLLVIILMLADRNTLEPAMKRGKAQFVVITCITFVCRILHRCLPFDARI